MANANTNQYQFQWTVATFQDWSLSNHHDESDCTLTLGKPTKFHICPRTFLCFPFHWYWIVKYGSLSCSKSQESSTPKVSRHAFALLAFEPVTSTNQNNSAMIALKAIAEMHGWLTQKGHAMPSERWHMSINVSTELNPSFSWLMCPLLISNWFWLLIHFSWSKTSHYASTHQFLRETKFLREHKLLHPCWLLGATWHPFGTPVTTWPPSGTPATTWPFFGTPAPTWPPSGTPAATWPPSGTLATTWPLARPSATTQPLALPLDTILPFYRPLAMMQPSDRPLATTSYSSWPLATSSFSNSAGWLSNIGKQSNQTYFGKDKMMACMDVKKDWQLLSNLTQWMIFDTNTPKTTKKHKLWLSISCWLLNTIIPKSSMSFVKIAKYFVRE